MIFDISPPITPSLKVWPGDIAPRRKVLTDIDSGSNITLSSLHSTVHLGAHADAPNHYASNSDSIGERELHYYLGQCQVLHINVARGCPILPELIKSPI